MKNAFLLLLIFTIFSKFLFSQTNSTEDATSRANAFADSLFLKDIKRYTVPDIPAFKTLGTSSDPSTLLRISPSTPISLNVLNGAFGASNFVLPKSFAAEGNLWQLMHPNDTAITLGKLTTIHPNSFNFSVGSFRNADLTTSAALALRMEWSPFWGVAKRFNAYGNVLQEKGKEKAIKKYGSVEGLSVDKQKEWVEKVEAYQRHYVDSLYSDVPLSEHLKNAYTSWNAPQRFAAAIAALGKSQDSLSKNLQFDGAEGWFTYAGRTKAFWKEGNGISQLQIGINVRAKKMLPTADFFNYRLSGSARWYLGNNYARWWFEGQFSGLWEKAVSTDPYQNTAALTFNTGAEINPAPGIQINFSTAGSWNITLQKAQFIPTLNLLYSPQNMYR